MGIRCPRLLPPPALMVWCHLLNPLSPGVGAYLERGTCSTRPEWDLATALPPVRPGELLRAVLVNETS